jgi:hypothetical protein
VFDRDLDSELPDVLSQFPAAALVGPRQVGKTTLAKQVAAQIGGDTLYLDLEDPRDDARLFDPLLFFETNAHRCVILDEIQRRKDLFPMLRSAIDSNRRPGRFILLGSGSPELIRDTSESLAGRICYLQLLPLSYPEVRTTIGLHEHWLRGGFPLSLLAIGSKQSMRWRQSFIQTYIERDLPMLGLPLTPADSRKLLRMLAHVHGQLLNYANLSKSLGVTAPSVRSYVDFLEHAFIVTRLEPYHSNNGKRLTRSPKIYMQDTGILHALNGIQELNDLFGHPAAGASWEGYVIRQLTARLPDHLTACYYRSQHGAELDLLIMDGKHPLVGFEIKLSTAPTVSRGVYEAMSHTGLQEVMVVSMIADSFPLKREIQAVSVDAALKRLQELGCVR